MCHRYQYRLDIGVGYGQPGSKQGIMDIVKYTNPNSPTEIKITRATVLKIVKKNITRPM
jgi:hypothetical protein